MGKIARKASDREETPKPKRKRRKKDLDKIHTKILKAKRKLDNVGKDGVRKRQAKICSRLLPKPAAGIYRNGAKGKDIRKAETSENTFNKARLKADALELFNGNTPESKGIIEIVISSSHDAAKQLPNKSFVKNSLEWTPFVLEHSPVLGKSQNQKLCLVKKKGGENFFENLDPNKIRNQNVNDELRYAVQKEDMCKRRLFQNDRDQLEVITTTQTQIFDEIELIKENRANKKTEQVCPENSKAASCTPLSHYTKLCRIIAAENFEGDFLQNYQSDPVTTTIKKLRHTYADCFRKQLLREKKLTNMKLSGALPVKYQTCTYSDISQLSSVEFEVPRSSENRTIAARLLDDEYQKSDKLHLIQNAKHKETGNVTHYNSTSYSRNTFAAYDANCLAVESRENSDDQCAKQSTGIRQSQKPMNFHFMNERDSAQLLDSQKNPKVTHTSKNKRHNKDNFHIDIPGYETSRHINSAQHLGTSIFSSDFTLPAEGHSSRDYSREKLQTAIFDSCAPNDVLRRCNDGRTDTYNIKNIRRIPTILRRCGNVITDKNTQMNDDYTEGLYKKFEANLFDGNPNITKVFHETELPNAFSLPTSSIVNAPLDRTKVLEPQIGSMKIKDSQESQVEMFDGNARPDESSEFGFCRFDNSHPRTFEASYNANVCTEKPMTQREQVAPNAKKYIFHSNNYRPINCLHGTDSSDSNAQPARQFPQRTKLHTCETNNARRDLFGKSTRDQNQNILFHGVNDRAMPTTASNFPRHVQTDERSRQSTCAEMFDKTDVECAKSQTNQNACRCNERYVYRDSANCPRKYNFSQAHHVHEETARVVAQPETSYGAKVFNGSTDNCINLSNAVQNVPLLSVEQKHNPYAYMMIDGQRRAMLNVAQPIKYLAVKNGPDIQRIPVYINDGNVRVAENVPLKVIALMDPNTQTKAFPREVTAQVVPVQTKDLQFDFATRGAKDDQSFVKHLDPVNAILFNSDLQSNIWYASNM